MKCKNCNKEIQTTMKYCPYCSNDLSSQILDYKKKEKSKKILIFCITMGILIVMFVLSRFFSPNSNHNNKATSNKNQLSDMVNSICNGDYKEVYTNKDFNNQGIYECKENNYVYYVHDLKEMCGLYTCGELYELGYVYHKDIETVFPNSMYYYRESRVSTLSSELKIAVVANSENDLIENYAEKFYQLIKNLNATYKKDLRLNIYFNSTLSGINTTYDKLFLISGFYTNNVTQSYGMGTGHGEYVFYDGDPYDLLSAIFSDKNNFPANARNALKFNRNINLEITDGKTITLDDFIEGLKNSFDESF